MGGKTTRAFEGILELHLLILLANSPRVFRDIRVRHVIESSEHGKLYKLLGNLDD